MMNISVFSVYYFILKCNFRNKVIRPGKRLTLSSSTSVTSEASLYTALGTDDEFHDMSSENEESNHSNMLNEMYIILFNYLIPSKHLKNYYKLL